MKSNNLLTQFDDDNELTLLELNKQYHKCKKELNQQLRHLKRLRNLGRKVFKSMGREEKLANLATEEKNEQTYSKTLSALNKDLTELDKSYIELRNKIKTQENVDEGVEYDLGG